MLGRVAVIIGRFAPFHNCHAHVIESILQRNPSKFIVVVGSAYQPTNFRTPFSSQERIEMVKACYPSLIFLEQRDWLYDQKRWETEVKSQVNWYADDLEIDLIAPPGASEYSREFSMWRRVPVAESLPYNATMVRKALFEGHDFEYMVPNPVINYIKEWQGFEEALHDYNLVTQYRENNSKNQYSAAIHCTDAVVIADNNVLLVKRGDNQIGRNQWALPGGHVEPSEESLVACRRELFEEAELNIYVDPVTSMTFSSPNRDARGRCVTEVFRFNLANRAQVKGGDDAQDARWFPLGSLDSSVMYADHFQIVQKVCFR